MNVTVTRKFLTATWVGILLNLPLNFVFGVGEGKTLKVSFVVDPSRVLNRIDEKIYGHFFEHIYHSANGGLWGELVWNRSFEENAAILENASGISS